MAITFTTADLKVSLKNTYQQEQGATVFGYHVNDPERYGVVDFDSDWNALTIEEKPATPKSNYAVTALYYNDNRVVDFVKQAKPSHRGELEITDLNNLYLQDGSLKVELMGSLAKQVIKSGYGDYLMEIISDRVKS